MLAVVSLVIAISAALLLLLVSAQAQPVRLVEVSYTPTDVCPGDVVPYSVTWEVARPAVLAITVGHLRSNGDAIEPARGRVLVPMWRAGQITDRDAVFVVPDFPPGDYERTVGIEAGARRPAFLVQEYTIRDDCADR